MVRLLKHKIRPENAYFKAHDFDFILSAPKEELHQFFIGLYGDHLLPARAAMDRAAMDRAKADGRPIDKISLKIVKDILNDRF